MTLAPKQIQKVITAPSELASMHAKEKILIDEYILQAGWPKSKEVMIFTGGVSSGKTGCMLRYVRDFISSKQEAKENSNVLMFSFAHADFQIAVRLAAMSWDMTYREAARRAESSQDLLMLAISSALSEALTVFDAGTAKVSSLEKMINNYVSLKGEPALVVIDGSNLIIQGKEGNRVKENWETFADIKTMAAALNIPVVLEWSLLARENSRQKQISETAKFFDAGLLIHDRDLYDPLKETRATILTKGFEPFRDVVITSIESRKNEPYADKSDISGSRSTRDAKVARTIYDRMQEKFSAQSNFLPEQNNRKDNVNYRVEPNDQQKKSTSNEGTKIGDVLRDAAQEFGMTTDEFLRVAAGRDPERKFIVQHVTEPTKVIKLVWPESFYDEVDEFLSRAAAVAGTKPLVPATWVGKLLADESALQRLGSISLEGIELAGRPTEEKSERTVEVRPTLPVRVIEALDRIASDRARSEKERGIKKTTLIRAMVRDTIRETGQAPEFEPQ